MGFQMSQVKRGQGLEIFFLLIFLVELILIGLFLSRSEVPIGEGGDT